MSRYTRGSRFSLQMVLDYIETHGVTRMKDLPDDLKNFIYREKLNEELPFNRERIGNNEQKRLSRREKEFRENRLQDWYDLERILPYLEKWAREEKTTIELQAIEGCLDPEWEQWVVEHPEYRGR